MTYDLSKYLDARAIYDEREAEQPDIGDIDEATLNANKETYNVLTF